MICMLIWLDNNLVLLNIVRVNSSGCVFFIGQGRVEVHWGHLREDPPQHSGPYCCSRSGQISRSWNGCGRSGGLWVLFILFILFILRLRDFTQHSSQYGSVVLHAGCTNPSWLCDTNWVNVPAYCFTVTNYLLFSFSSVTPIFLWHPQALTTWTHCLSSSSKALMLSSIR